MHFIDNPKNRADIMPRKSKQSKPKPLRKFDGKEFMLYDKGISGSFNVNARDFANWKKKGLIGGYRTVKIGNRKEYYFRLPNKYSKKK